MQPELQDTITLERTEFTDESTIGDLIVDGDHFCFTLEDTCRATKIYGKTAIPAGRYEVIISHSVRFEKELPLLMEVPGFFGIRIHSGNTPEDTEGCILVGMRKGPNVIYDSKKAFDLLMPEIERRLANGKVFISVIGGNHAA